MLGLTSSYIFIHKSTNKNTYYIYTKNWINQTELSNSILSWIIKNKNSTFFFPIWSFITKQNDISSVK